MYEKLKQTSLDSANTNSPMRDPLIAQRSARNSTEQDVKGVHEIKTDDDDDDDDGGQRSFRAFETLEGLLDERGKAKYPPNLVITSRYTIVSFVPKSLFEQFRRLANVYFLVIGIIAAIGTYGQIYESSLEPQGILGPMMLVIFISIAKEGIEDYKRHREDALVNAKPTHVILESGLVVERPWRDLKIGSVILLLCNDEVPADSVVLACGGVQGNTCYVSTAAIDGETSLKIRLPSLGAEAASCIKTSQDKTSVTGLDGLGVVVTAERPSGSINRFNGYLDHRKGVTTSISVSDTEKTDRVALTEKHLLLRGSVLRATEWCVAVVTYTGRDTKLSLNSKSPPSKLSSVDRVVNKTLFIAISTMLIVCVFSMAFNVIWTSMNSGATYLCLYADDLEPRFECSNDAPNSVLTVFTFATLYNNFVCISMYVSLEMVYLFQAYFIANDLEMYDESSDSPAVVHNSGMCADLGQVQYVLSDKTGTLTQNSMKLRRCSLLNKVFGAPVLLPGGDETSPSRGTELRHSSVQKVVLQEKWEELERLSSLPADSSQIGEDFLRVLAACNTVMLMPDVLTGKLDIHHFKDLEKSLQAESPDEVALALAVGEYANLLLIERNSSSIVTRNASGKIERMKLLAVNEFESNRKRMSVLVKFEDTGKYMLLCKGADTSTLDRCVNSQYTSSCMQHIDQFARTGLRTLVLARRVLSEKDALAYLTNYRVAANSIGHREEMLARCADEMEVSMELLGAVGIEDQLQVGVPESISMLQRMGLNVWMITGDKAETAEAISRMCCLLRSEHRVLRLVGLRGEELRRQLEDVKAVVLETKAANINRLKELNLRTKDDNSVVDKVWRRFASIFKVDDPSSDETGDNIESTARKDSSVSISSNNIPPLALIVDGSSLEAIWTVPDLVMLFTEITRDIATVIACRVSPLQKASLVRMVKHDPLQPVTLAIGDGANDVGMIHEAKVGVGINGKEGKHASNSADFALGQFRFLIPLLLEHGRFNYVRCSNLVLYSFFKNLVLVSCLFYYCIYSGFSGSMPIDSIVIGGFNFYLGIPIILLGAFDWDVPKASVRRHPFLAYATGRLGEMLNMSNMFHHCVLAFLQGLIIFAVVVRCIAGELSVRPARDQIYDIDGVGLNDKRGRAGGIYAEGFLLLSCIIMAMQTKVLFMGTTTNWIMILWWLISIIGFYMFNLLYSQFPSLEWYQVVAFTMELKVYWLAFFLVPAIITITDYIVEYAYAIYRPSSRDKLLSVIAEEAELQEYDIGSLSPSVVQRLSSLTSSSCDVIEI